MPQLSPLAQALQSQLAPGLHAAAAAFAAALERRADPAEIAAQPNLGLLLQAMADRRVAGDGAVLSFGSGNQIGDVSVGDVAMGSITKITLNLQLGQGAPLIARVDPPDPAADLAGANANGAPPAPAAPARPCRVLVLDGRCDSESSAALRRALHLRGIASPAPAPLDDLSARTLRDALADADAAVVVLSPASCAAPRLAAVELPALWGRYGQAAPFTVVPLLDGVEPALAEATLALPGTRLENFRALALPADPPARPDALAALAGLLLRTVTGPRLARAAATSPLALTLFSYPPSGPTPPADLALSWDALFPEPEQPTRRPPGPEVWRASLDPALDDLRAVVGASGAHTLTISGRYHLPVGLALGYRFRSTVNMALQVAAQPGGVWASADPADEGELLQRVEVPGVSGASDLSVEVSLSRDVRDDAGGYLAAAGVAYARRVQLTSAPIAESGDINTARMFITSPAHARRLAAQIANIILGHGRGTVHLFVAIPQGLAVLIGAQLNRTRPVQCYDLFDAPDVGRVYVPTAILH